MMNIESYYQKIEAIIDARKSSKTGKSSKRGLLTPSGKDDPTSTKKQTSQMLTVVEIIEGIREAREEIVNGKK
jgi:hypothetical protein